MNSKCPVLIAIMLTTAAAEGASRTNVIGWWPFDGDATDAAWRTHNGIVLGGASFDAAIPPGQAGQSIRFGADGDGVRIAANPLLNPAEFTLGYFINLEGVLQGNAGLERLSSRAGNTFETAAGPANALGGTSSSTGTTLSYYSPATGWTVTHVELPADGWVHVAWRNTADAMELYLDGELVFTGAAIPIGIIDGLLSFGTRFDQVEGFQGLMHDAFLADGSITPEDIAAIADQGVGKFFGFTTDTDGDGLPDWWETEFGLDPADPNAANGASGDPDNDSLTNVQEYARRTKPNDRDSDDDGLDDGAEVTRGTNPNLADTDGDGLTDADEVTRQTDPLKADSDGDLITDGNEVALGTDPLDPLSGPPASTFLVMHLKFDGDAQDSSTSANHGALRETPDFINDSPLSEGQALALGGNGMGIEVAGNPTLAANAFTLAFWVKPTADQEGAFERLTGRAGYAFETAVGPRDAGPQTLSYYQTTGWHSTGINLPFNHYSHVAFRNRGPGPLDLDVFINGVLAFTGPGVPAAGPGDGLMSIGNAFNNVEGFEGLIDDVRLYRAPIRQSDVATLAVPADSDGDGLPDWWERLHNFNPQDNGSINAINGGDGDADNDSLPNSQEYIRQTNPRVADTDEDGLSDGAEVTGGTNPLVPDTDGDGLTDLAEQSLGTNPTLVDTDGDGISDKNEVDAGTNPLDPTSGPAASSFLVLHLDFDGDTEDNSPLGNHGSLLGAPEFSTDTPISGGQSLSFFANDMGVTVAENDSLASNQFTLAYWVKPTSLQEGAGLERLTSRAGDRFETAIGNASALGGAPELTLSYFQGAGWRRTGVSLPLNAWSHVAWRNRGPGAADLDLLVDGRVVFTGPGVPADGPGSGHMNIGTRHNGIEGFEGLIDDVRLYRAPLRNSDIAALVGVLNISQFTRSPDGGSVTILFSSQPGETFTVERTVDLRSQSWTRLVENLASTGTETTFVDLTAASLPGAFYRIRRNP